MAGAHRSGDFAFRLRSTAALAAVVTSRSAEETPDGSPRRARRRRLPPGRSRRLGMSCSAPSRSMELILAGSSPTPLWRLPRRIAARKRVASVAGALEGEVHTASQCGFGEFHCRLARRCGPDDTIFRRAGARRYRPQFHCRHAEYSPHWFGSAGSSALHADAFRLTMLAARRYSPFVAHVLSRLDGSFA